MSHVLKSYVVRSNVETRLELDLQKDSPRLANDSEHAIQGWLLT